MAKKPSAASAVAAQLLVSRSRRRAVATDESIEFFSALRDCETDPRISVQTGRRPTEDGSGKVRQSGGDGVGHCELLSTEIGKHDYDWLLTPPATPLRSPRTSGDATRSAAALNRLARATSASYAKNNSPLSLTRRGNGINPTSRLARSSSSATHASVNSTAIAASSRGLSHVRTLSLASSSSSSSSSSTIAARNGSGSSTPSGSAVTTPRTPPAHARSTGAANAGPRPWDKAHARLQVSSATGPTAGQRKASSTNSGLSSSAPTSARRPRATTGASSPRSTTVTLTSRQPEELTSIRGANAVARSRFASHGTAGSTAHGVGPSVKPRGPVVSAPGVKQCYGNGMAVASTATKRWSSSLRSPSPAVAAGRESAPRGELSAKRLSMNDGDGRLTINVEKAAKPHRTAGLAPAAVPSGLTRTASRKPANTDAKRTGKENVDSRKCKDAKPTVHHRSIRATASRSGPGSMAATYDGGSGSIAGGQCTSEKGKLAVVVDSAAAARLTETEAPFASTRYDAMLSREDPKNLTWLNGCSGVDSNHDGSGVADLVECLLEEPFDVPVY